MPIIGNPVSSVADAVTSVSLLVEGILSRSDRDRPDKEKNENIIALQNGFADNDTDKLGVLVQLLLAKAGHPPTPSGDAGLYRREIFHALSLCAIELIHERQLVTRLVAKLNDD